MEPNSLEAFGLHGSVLLAGFAGGLCYVMTVKPPLWDSIRALVVATLTTNYAYELGSKYLGAGTGIGLAAFSTGLAAPFIIRAIIYRAQQWSGTNGNGKDTK